MISLLQDPVCTTRLFVIVAVALWLSDVLCKKPSTDVTSSHLADPLDLAVATGSPMATLGTHDSATTS